MTKVHNELSNYQNVPRELVFDKTLSARARFVYVFMACKPDGWDFFLEPMANDIGYSVDTLRKYINELVASGWLEKGEQANEHGIFGAVEYTLKATKITDTENLRHGKNNAQDNKEIFKRNEILNKEEGINIPPKKNDYQSIVDCWNESNGKKLGMVTKLTDKRKKAIKKQLIENEITQEQLMSLFKTLPFADSWLYNPNKQHANWKPDFDWWLANTNGWLTKALEGKVHKENPNAFRTIMSAEGETIPYIPQGRKIWFNEQTKTYWCDDPLYDDVIYDGYTDDSRPDGATLTLHNGRGDIHWSKQQRKWIFEK